MTNMRYAEALENVLLQADCDLPGLCVHWSDHLQCACRLFWVKRVLHLSVQVEHETSNCNQNWDLLLKIFHFQRQHSIHVLHLLLCVESKGGVMRSWFQWKWKLNACWHLVLSNVKVHRLSIREMRHSLKWTISSREWQKYWTEPNGLKHIEGPHTPCAERPPIYLSISRQQGWRSQRWEVQAAERTIMKVVEWGDWHWTGGHLGRVGLFKKNKQEKDKDNTIKIQKQRPFTKKEKLEGWGPQIQKGLSTIK